MKYDMAGRELKVLDRVFFRRTKKAIPEIGFIKSFRGNEKALICAQDKYIVVKINEIALFL